MSIVNKWLKIWYAGKVSQRRKGCIQWRRKGRVRLWLRITYGWRWAGAFIHFSLTTSLPPDIPVVSLSLFLSLTHMHAQAHMHTSYKAHPTRMTPESFWDLQNRSPFVPQGLTASPQIPGLDPREHREMFTEFSDEAELYKGKQHEIPRVWRMNRWCGVSIN